MTLLKTLRAHAGGLVRIKGELYWRRGAGWDRSPGRVCLLLDAARTRPLVDAAARRALDAAPLPPIAALLLIDGAPHWIWVSQEDVELIT